MPLRKQPQSKSKGIIAQFGGEDEYVFSAVSAVHIFGLRLEPCRKYPLELADFSLLNL